VPVDDAQLRLLVVAAIFSSGACSGRGANWHKTPKLFPRTRGRAAAS